jgi:hypothetical protein
MLQLVRIALHKHVRFVSNWASKVLHAELSSGVELLANQTTIEFVSFLDLGDKGLREQILSSAKQLEV